MIIEARKMLSGNQTDGDCAVCGGETSILSKNIKKAVSSSFTDWQALIQGTSRLCCSMCENIIKTTHMRTKCIICISPGCIIPSTYEDVYKIIKNPPEKFVVSVPYSFKRHHWLYAGISTPQRMLIGTDTATIEYIPEIHRDVLSAIETMISAGVPSRQIESGNYHPANIAIVGNEFERLENIISEHRGTGLVKLLVKVSPKIKIDNWEVENVRTEEQAMAARYLVALAECSNFRAENGMQFWGGFFEARVNRVAGLSFDIATNKLMKSLQCHPSGGIVSIIDELTDDQKKEVMKTLKEQTKLCVSLAYSDMKKGKTK